MKGIKKRWKMFVNQLGLWGSVGVVRYWQEENILHITVQRIGLFRRYVGIPFVCDIEIDPTLVVQSPK